MIFLFESKGCESSPFQIINGQKWVSLTDSMVRRHFPLILTRLDLAHSGIPQSTLSGIQVPLLFSITMVALQNIQRYFTWTSDCVWTYITDFTDAGEQVAEMFRSKLSSS